METVPTTQLGHALPSLEIIVAHGTRFSCLAGCKVFLLRGCRRLPLCTAHITTIATAAIWGAKT